MSKRKVFIGCIFILLILAFIAEWKSQFFSSFMEAQIVKYEKKIQNLKEERYLMNFVITGKKDGTISGKFVFFDTDDGMIGSPFLFSVKGNEVFFDFIVTPFFDDEKLVFPHAIFSDEIPPEDGNSIIALYKKGDKPLIFYPKAQFLSKKSESKIKETYKALINGQKMTGSWGNAVHDVCKIENFIIGMEYRIFVHKNGGIEIVEK